MLVARRTVFSLSGELCPCQDQLVEIDFFGANVGMPLFSVTFSAGLLLSWIHDDLEYAPRCLQADLTEL